MPDENAKRKQLLFVDDDEAFLTTTTQLFAEMSRGAWEIFTATNHAAALQVMQEQRIELVVLDIGMPVMDGTQFLRLIARAHPGLPVAMLTGLATPENRRSSMENGAALVLQKPTQPGEIAMVFAALEALAGAMPQEGFRGLMRQVGLQDVLQMECLNAKSSVLEIFTGKVRGQIFIHEGLIVHAESGSLQGEVALYSLLALRGGGFNLQAYVEPSRRSIEGHWEFLLMEAARLRDEQAQGGEVAPPADPPVMPVADVFSMTDTPVVPPPSVATPDLPRAPEFGPVRIEEIVLCSGAGEVLYEWECGELEPRLKLFTHTGQQAGELLKIAPFLGRFERLEMVTREGRAVCEVQPERRMFVRVSPSGEEIR